MDFSLSNILNIVVSLLLIIVLPGLIQYYMSTRKSKWFGLALPACSILYSIAVMLQVVLYSFDSIFEVFLQLFVVFLISNIPTLVFIVIYAFCRTRIDRELHADNELS